MSLYFDQYPIPVISVYGCTVKDHSDYIEDTDRYNTLTLAFAKEKTFCDVCKLPEYRSWYMNIEWENRDKTYWKNLFKSIATYRPYWTRYGSGECRIFGNPDGPEGSVWHNLRVRPGSSIYSFVNLCKTIRKDRYYRRLQRPKENHYPGYQELIELELNARTKDESCVDNERWAALDSRADMKRFRKLRDRGCCGSHDEEITVLGRKFMIGFNYGH